MISLHRQRYDPPDGARTGARAPYVIGDIHGCYDLLHALLAEIARDAADRQPGVTPMLVMCGDYIDRGPASSKVLSALSWLVRSSAVEARLLEGNHEAALQMFLDDPVGHGQWIAFGGRETLQSYGVKVPEVVTDQGLLTDLRNTLLDVMPVSHQKLLQGLELMIQIGDYAVVHAGVRPGVPLRKQKREDLLWIREDFIDHPRPAPCVIVHGHTWLDDQPVILPHRIGIDTGAYETGVLTAIRIADDELEVIQARRSEASNRSA